MSFSIYATKATSHLLLPTTVIFICSIWWSSNTNNLILPIAIAFLFVAFYFFSQKTVAQKILNSLFLSFVFFSGNNLYHFQQKKHSYTQKSICGKPCTIIGKISSIEKSKQKFMDNIITINLYEIKKIGQWWIKIDGAISIYTKKIENLSVSDTIEIRNLFFKQTTNSSFDQYLIKNGIVATTFVPDLNYTILHRPQFSFFRWLSEQKQKNYKNIKKKISPKSFSFFSSIFLGNRTIKNFSYEKTKAEFKNWGILHFLARSGLHLVIFILLWSFILSFIPLSFFINQIILIILSLLYCSMSWTSVSFFRALSVFLLYKIMPLTNLRTQTFYLLLTVCLATLIYNPIQLLFLDFQLSFGLACALAWFGQLLLQKRYVLKKY